MKRILILSITVLSVLLLMILPAYAEESVRLIPANADWVKTDNNGTSVTVEEIDGAFVFSGSTVGSWPCATAMYSSAPVAAPLDSYSLGYDFTVDGGATNINFFFETAHGGSVDYSICNSMFADRNYDVGSGDLYSGEYKGAIKLSQLVETTRLYNGEAFPTDAIVDGTLRFVGVQVYSVNGGVITVRALDLVHNDDVVVEEESPAESIPQEESSASESAISEEPEETAPVSDSEETDDVSEVEKSSTVTNTSTVDNKNVDSTSVLVTIIAVVVILLCIFIVAMFLKKKQHK